MLILVNRNNYNKISFLTRKMNVCKIANQLHVPFQVAKSTHIPTHYGDSSPKKYKFCHHWFSCHSNLFCSVDHERRYSKKCLSFSVFFFFFIQWKKMVTKNVWLATFFKVSFVFCRRKNVREAWNNIWVSK